MTTFADDTNASAKSSSSEADANAASAPRSTPGDELKSKKEKLKAAQDRIAELNKNATSLLQEVQILEAKIAEVTQAAIVFKAASDLLTRRQEKVTATMRQKISMAQAVIP